MEMLRSSVYYLWFYFILLIICKSGHCERTLINYLAKGRNKSVPISALTVSDSSCPSRGNNCSFCLSDGNCGFCDTCKDICHHPEAAGSPNCSNCARCIPGALDGPKKGHECRVEWFYYEKCPEVVNEQKTVYVEIALYLINIHSVDLKAGTFHADFYLYFKVPDGQTKYTKQKCKDGPKGACFELVNAAGQPEVSSHEGKYFRVKATFNFAADLRDYPYDNQTLRIVIQDMEMAAKELRWKHMQGNPDGQDFKFRSGVSPMLNYTGWLFDTNSWSQMVYERYNPFLDQGVSRYEFFFHMRRHKRAAFFKIFLPPLFIVLVVCFSFSIPPKDSSMRLWIDGSLLISAVMFHATTGEQTPDSQVQCNAA
ncbi:Neurotransmitter-gated ion-channel transmembrane region [Paramuricea clavata]|uniref:Neurotransmitter-gated ion-channel transmembrane region n=2 Tax=Paramuricea clavata TaxID=317549 RepID=A0A7D9JFG1_PARCT|nr:Neurotransmitter-gated ion-channel transmembrane region [Paramuricea clavata]